MTVPFRSIGVPELILILILALIIFGPRKLPEIGKALGNGIREFRNATRKLSAELADEDSKKDQATKQVDAKKKDE